MQKTSQVAKEQLNWVKGHKVTVHEWLNLCRYSSDARFQNLAVTLEWALATGRMPNWLPQGYDRFFTKDNKVMTNCQVRAALAQAADSQESLTQAAALVALQKAFGLRH